MKASIKTPALLALAVLALAGVLYQSAQAGLTNDNQAQGVVTYEFFDNSASSTATYAVGTTTSATSSITAFVHSTNGRYDNGVLNDAFMM